MLSYLKTWQKENKEYINEMMCLTRWIRRFYILILKSDPCIDCKKKYPPECMQFDHVYGKKNFNIGSNRSNKSIDYTKEIEKCELVCANCHARRTWKRLKRRMKSKF
jgi:hypothetical protein